MDGAVSRVGQQEPAVDAPGRNQSDVRPLRGENVTREPCGVAGVARARAVREAPRPQSGADGKEVVETEGASGSIAHREVGHPVHQLVPDDVQHRERLLARLVGPPAVCEHAVAFRAERWQCKEGIRDIEVDQGDRAPVPAVDALPAVPRREVVVRPAGVGVGVDHRRVVPVVVRVGRVVVRRPDRLSRGHEAQKMLGEQPPVPLEVEPDVESDDLCRPQPIVRVEPVVLLRRVQLPRVSLEARTGADRRLRPERTHAMQDPAVAGVGEVEVPVAHRDLVGEGVRAVRQRQDAERRLPAGEDLSAVHRFEKRGDLGPGQRRRRIHGDPLVQCAEQRHGDPAGVELPGDASAEHGNARMVLGEILVGASIDGCVVQV